VFISRRFNRCLTGPALAALAVFAAVVGAPTAAAAAQAPDLTGVWRLTPRAGEDLMAALLRHNSEQGIRSRAGIPGGGQPGVSGRLPGGNSVPQPDAGPAAGDLERLHHDIAALLEATDAFELRQDDSTVTLYPLDLSYGHQVFHPDGRKTHRDLGFEDPVEIRSRWDNGRLRVERKEQDLRATTTYQVAGSGESLIVDTRVVGRMLAKPLPLRRVYRRAGSSDSP